MHNTNTVREVAADVGGRRGRSGYNEYRNLSFLIQLQIQLAREGVWEERSS